MDVTRTSSAQRQTLPAEVSGATDGPDVVLSSGMRLRRTRVGTARVTDFELAQAIRGVQLLPLSHQQVIARLGIVIELIPVRALEQIAGTTDPVVGATAIVGDIGRGRATRIRIATRMAENPHPARIEEIIQHEIGHVLAVTAYQDRSEAAAEAYAARY